MFTETLSSRLARLEEAEKAARDSYEGATAQPSFAVKDNFLKLAGIVSAVDAILTATGF